MNNKTAGENDYAADRAIGMKGGQKMKEKERYSILVVDNNYFALKATAELLKEYGYSVIVCKNSGNVINILRKKSIDVVLSDISMPDISGVELLENIHKLNPDIPVILMTAYAKPELADFAVKRGAFDLLVKPYNAESLVKTVKEAVEHTGQKQRRKSCQGKFEVESQQRTREVIDTLIKKEKADVKRFSKSSKYWLNGSRKNEY